jgi:hypothetical protein
MGASQVPATSALTDNYELISSVTASGSSVAFTSISGYKKLMLRCNAVLSSGGATNRTWTLRLNADSTSKYDYAFHYDGSTPNYRGVTLTGQTEFGFPQSASELYAFFIFNNTDTTGVKSIEGSFKVTDATPVSYTSSDYSGNYYASASVSTVTVSIGTGSLSGTIALYGVRV